jgi:cytochrome c2
MKRIVAILFLAGLWAIHPAEGQEIQLSSNILAGRKIFEQQNCSRCHSVFEKDSRKIGPQLQADVFFGSFLDIFSILWNHAPAMSLHMKREGLPRPNFSPQELNQLISFLYLLPFISAPGDPSKGVTVLRDKGCLRCHRIGRLGQEQGISLDSLSYYRTLTVLFQQMWNHGPLMLGEMIASGVPIPRLTGEDFADLFAAISQKGKEARQVAIGIGDVTSGKAVFQKKGCIRCHRTDGDGGTTGPNLKEANLQVPLPELLSRIWNHVPSMQKQFRKMNLHWPYFTEAEMADLVVFLYSLEYRDNSGNPKRGEKIFGEKQCSTCHFQSPAHRQRLLQRLKNASAARFAAELWNHLPAMEQLMVARAVPWPELSGQDLRDLLAFLRRGLQKEK